MVDKAVVGACRGSDQIGNGAHISNLAKSSSGLAARRRLILLGHAHQAVYGITIPRHSDRARGCYANAKVGVVKGGANAFFSVRRANPIEPPHGGGTRFERGRM